MIVIEPFDTRLSAEVASLSLSQGSSTTLELKGENLPENSLPTIMNLPPGVTFRLTGRQADQITLRLEATPDAPLGSFDVSVEAQVSERWTSSQMISLNVLPPSKSNRVSR
jgi:hypothetical protein